MAQVICRGPGNLVRSDQTFEGGFVMHLASSKAIKSQGDCSKFLVMQRCSDAQHCLSGQDEQPQTPQVRVFLSYTKWVA